MDGIGKWFKRVAGWMVLLLVCLLAVVLWPTPPPSPEVIAKRGILAPEKPSSLWKGTIGGAQDWFDKNLEMFADWKGNPFGFHRNHICQHLMELQASKDPNDQAEYRRLIDLAKQWHENLLARYPGLRVRYRDIPDERNALKLLSDLQKRLSGIDSDFCRNAGQLSEHQNKSPWDPGAVQEWLDAHRSALDEFRKLCLLPESSGKDLSMEADELVFYMNGQRALVMDARMAAERCDWPEAMKSLEAVIALSNHLQNSESPYLLHGLFGGSMRDRASDFVFQTILPNLPSGQADLQTWENLLQPTIQTPENFARMQRGDWNGVLLYQLLPALADPRASGKPADGELFVEAYTSHAAHIVGLYEPLALSDLPSKTAPTFDTSDLSWLSRKLGEGMSAEDRFLAIWQQQQVSAGLTRAAFAILKGQPVTNDPIYGKPYSWNPETRQLSLPDSPEFSKMEVTPIKLPKL
jgi:hypothetical protein